MATYSGNVPMANANARLNPNEIYAAIFNMIISQDIFADNFKKHSPLTSRYRVDGSMYGDTKLYYATDCLPTHKWGADAEAPNLLELARAESPRVQAITLDQFRQVRVTTDDYLSKRAWGDEGSFSRFTSLIKGKVAESKRIYDSRLIKTFIGTHKAVGAGQNVTVAISSLPPASDGLEVHNRLVAQTIAEKIANLFDSLGDETRDYNDYGFLRSYDIDDFDIIWNSVYANKFKFMDLPSLFNNGDVKEKLSGEKLQSVYFGTINAAATKGNATGTVRSLVETDFGNTHVFPGDAVPNNQEAKAGESYTVDDKVICKIIHKKAVVYMSGFQTTTSFWNPRSLTETTFLCFGYSDPVQLTNYPYITIASDA